MSALVFSSLVQTCTREMAKKENLNSPYFTEVLQMALFVKASGQRSLQTTKIVYSHEWIRQFRLTAWCGLDGELKDPIT